MNDAWDQRIARWMVKPLIGTWVTPNHLTTMRLLTGLISVAGFTIGDYFWSNIAALGFSMSNLIDHTDGELARMSGQTSEWGHYYDLGCDAIIHILLFVCIGIGLTANMQSGRGIVLGFIAGVSVTSIFWFRMKIEELQGKLSVQQPRWVGFEMEDVMYLIPLVTLFDGLKLFLVLGATTSPWVAIFFGWKYFYPAKN
tara:strand:+ start:3550 stop:4143 length:594 start_codon:yes stop_codon:yes gene_type:complete